MNRVVIAAIVFFVLMLVGAIGTLVSTPSHFVISSSRLIPMPVAKIYPMIGDLKNWKTWSPWVNRDDTMEITYEGESDKSGARQLWTSENSGAGKILFMDLVPNNSVNYTIEFSDWNTTHVGYITLAAQPEGTLVTWNMEGDLSLKDRFFWRIFRVDQMVHKDFDEGLVLLEKSLSQ